ncbi:hypothetical protein J0S82_000850 [Galemys pyrenaicus]|uniref:Uncharacterized protein n=1 Tax=Galemys pyrenaicus TaxID=202257 RepID=A0A8J6ADU9_GALPY|nr:hypothetical protein J0S82_000850 [Galemys pyrenaicus]
MIGYWFMLSHDEDAFEPMRGIVMTSDGNDGILREIQVRRPTAKFMTEIDRHRMKRLEMGPCHASEESLSKVEYTLQSAIKCAVIFSWTLGWQQGMGPLRCLWPSLDGKIQIHDWCGTEAMKISRRIVRIDVNGEIDTLVDMKERGIGNYWLWRAKHTKQQ